MKTSVMAAVALTAAAGFAASTADYVQTGLVGHWDGIDNAGTGTHEATAGVWKDLTGISGDFAINASVAAFAGGNALRKNAAGYMASNPTRPTNVRTIEVVVGSHQTKNAWVCAVYISKDQTVSFNDAINPECRTFFFDYDKYGWKTSLRQPIKVTIAATYSSAMEAAGVFQNGVTPRGVTYVNHWGNTGTAMSLGGRPGGTGAELKTTGFSIYAVRFYNRALTAAEAAQNAALDRERFNLDDTSDLVEDGFLSSVGYHYPYDYPIYIADVSDEKSISQVTFKKVESKGASTTTDVSFASFASSPQVGMILKTGSGSLTFDRDISTFTGPVHVAEGVVIGNCSNCFGSVVAEYTPRESQRVYVHNGATLVMDDVDSRNKYAESNAIYFEGEGCPGLGGALVVRNGESAEDAVSYWQMGIGSLAVGPATIYMDIPEQTYAGVSWGDKIASNSHLSLNEQPVVIYGRTKDSVFEMNASALGGVADLVISNARVRVGGNAGRFVPHDGANSVLRFSAGSTYSLNTTANANNVMDEQTGTLCVDGLECLYLCHAEYLAKTAFGVDPWGGTTNNWWSGPVVLNDDVRLRNSNYAKYSVGFTFSNAISGAKGLRPWHNSSGVNESRGFRVNLLSSNNAFKGGIVLDEGSLGVWANGAVPAQEDAGLVSITNGYVYFGRPGRDPSAARWENFELPMAEFVGTGAVTNGTGTWRSLVKKGAGTLDYNSQIGGSLLDVQEGVVVFNTQYRANYDGDVEPSGYVAGLPSFAALAGTQGVLDLGGTAGSPVDYTVGEMTGTPSVTNGNLTVTSTWKMPPDRVNRGTAMFSGSLTFEPNATFEIADLATLERLPASGVTLVVAQGGVTGCPDYDDGTWRLVVSADQTRVKLKRCKGTVLIFR